MSSEQWEEWRWDRQRKAEFVEQYSSELCLADSTISAINATGHYLNEEEELEIRFSWVRDIVDIRDARRKRRLSDTEKFFKRVLQPLGLAATRVTVSDFATLKQLNSRDTRFILPFLAQDRPVYFSRVTDHVVHPKRFMETDEGESLIGHDGAEYTETVVNRALTNSLRYFQGYGDNLNAWRITRTPQNQETPAVE
jgi:hypothetical protein